MREIKFRVWRHWRGMMQWEDFVEKWNLEDIQIINKGPSEAILMQFTGLYDKNGKEIYEGDVVCYVTDEVVEVIGGYPRTEPEGHIGAVEFSNGAFWVNGNGEFYSYGEQNFLWSELEVIGNIYENPNLIENDKS